jgi:hypothetical protein
MINNILNKAKNIICKNGKSLDEVLDKKVNTNMYVFYPTNLPFDGYDIGDGQSLEMVVNTAKVYLLTIYNSYNVGGVYVVQAGTNRGPVKITQIAGDTSNFTVTAVSLNSFSVAARNATGRICIMCIGGANK